MTSQQAIDTLDQHGRDVLKRHFGVTRGCIPAAKMAQEFCRAVGVTCKVRPVVCVIRNQKAKYLNVWPWRDSHRATFTDAELADAACVICGNVPGGPKPKSDSINIHVVPVVLDGPRSMMVDITLDGQTTREDLGFTPLPTLVLPYPPGIFADARRGSALIADLAAEGLSGDIAYWRSRPDARHFAQPYWTHFWLLGGRAAVDELLEISR